MLIAARFSGPGSGKDLLSRAIPLIASGLLPFSSFPIPVAPDSYRAGILPFPIGVVVTAAAPNPHIWVAIRCIVGHAPAPLFSS